MEGRRARKRLVSEREATRSNFGREELEHVCGDPAVRRQLAPRDRDHPTRADIQKVLARHGRRVPVGAREHANPCPRRENPAADAVAEQPAPSREHLGHVALVGAGVTGIALVLGVGCPEQQGPAPRRGEARSVFRGVESDE